MIKHQINFFFIRFIYLMFNCKLLYYYRERLINAYENNFWDGALKTVAALWDAHGWIWYGNSSEVQKNSFIFYT